MTFTHSGDVKAFPKPTHLNSKSAKSTPQTKNSTHAIKQSRRFIQSLCYCLQLIKVASTFMSSKALTLSVPRRIIAITSLHPLNNIQIVVNWSGGHFDKRGTPGSSRISRLIRLICVKNDMIISPDHETSTHFNLIIYFLHVFSGLI